MLKRLPNLSTLITIGVVLLLVLGGLSLLLGGKDDAKLTAYFPRAISLYSGSDVRVLGVPIGKVDEVTPSGTEVKVTMTYDPEVKIPANAKAVIVSPSIVGDRFVQLIPAYTGGKVLASGAVFKGNRTAVPLELDQVYQGIDDLLVALGPKGANKDGALSNILSSTAANLAGQGEQLNRTITNLGRFTKTLADNKDQLFGTVTQVEDFVNTLAENDSTVRRFNDSLASAADLLEGERDDLAAALRNLGTALVEVRRFVQDNQQTLSNNIGDLNKLTKILVGQRDALDKILTSAPTALNNLYLTYNKSAGTLDTRSNLKQGFNLLETDPVAFLCAILRNQQGGTQACNAIQDSPLADVGKSLTDALPKPRSAPGSAGLTRSRQYGDPTLAGILGGDR